MSVCDNINELKLKINDKSKLIAVSKTYPVEDILEAYKCGQKAFGENKVQEMANKYDQLPKDIEWHLIGHLQSNKIKYMAPFVHLIHSVDTLKLLESINKEGQKINRMIPCLLQIHIAQEETKYGFSYEEAVAVFRGNELNNLPNIIIKGFMGMASNTESQELIRAEFRKLHQFQIEMKGFEAKFTNIDLKELSIGMSSHYPIAIEEGSTMVRVGTAIFGQRK